MDKFYNLPEEKQTAIIDGALKIFGNNGYKKASVSDIAVAAGISKAMVFHYFGTKKALYFYLINKCVDMITTEFDKKFNSQVTDFFDRIIQAATIKFAVLKKHPDTISFLTSVYLENNEEVHDGIKEILDQGDDIRSHLIFDGLDTSKFKESVDVQLVMNMLMLMSEGFVNTMSMKTEADMDKFSSEFYQCIQLLKDNLYKEDYV